MAVLPETGSENKGHAVQKQIMFRISVTVLWQLFVISNIFETLASGCKFATSHTVNLQVLAKNFSRNTLTVSANFAL